jgi:hypothetical protein
MSPAGGGWIKVAGELESGTNVANDEFCYQYLSNLAPKRSDDLPQHPDTDLRVSKEEFPEIDADAGTDAEVDALVGKCKRLAIRAARALLIWLTAFGLLQIQTYREDHLVLIATMLAVLSVTNLTKWVSAIGLAILVALVLLPPSVFG